MRTLTTEDLIRAARTIADCERALGWKPAAHPIWNHPDGTEHSVTGPLGCYPCANLRRAAIAKGAK